MGLCRYFVFVRVGMDENGWVSSSKSQFTCKYRLCQEKEHNKSFSVCYSLVRAWSKAELVLASSPESQQMPGAAQCPSSEPQARPPASQGEGRKFSSRQRAVSGEPR